MIKSSWFRKSHWQNPHLYHRDVERIVNVVFDEIVDALAQETASSCAASVPSQ